MSFTALYVRISTDGQNEASQKREIESWLNRNSIDRRKVKWYVDRKSGDTMDRPEFEKMQQDIAQGLVHTVVVYRLDRLSRKLRDGIDLVCSWCDHGIRLVCTSQQIDFNGSIGKIIAAVLLGFAEIEQSTRRERQAAGIAAAKERGVYTGRRKGALKKGVDPREALRLRENGLTHRQISRAMGVSIASVARYLKRAEMAS